MKLIEVQLRDKVSTGLSPGDTTSRLSAVMGWELSFEQGLVTAKKGESVRIIPLGNVTYLVPAPAEPKPVAKAKPAA